MGPLGAAVSVSPLITAIIIYGLISVLGICFQTVDALPDVIRIGKDQFISFIPSFQLLDSWLDPTYLLPGDG